MPSSEQRAKVALSDALKAALNADVGDLLIGGTHTRRFSDNLLRGFSQQQIAALRSELEAGAGGELRATRTGKRPAHAPYSSATLAINAFGGWLGRESDFESQALAGLRSALKSRVGSESSTTAARPTSTCSCAPTPRSWAWSRS
jgi:hypothetical protein